MQSSGTAVRSEQSLGSPPTLQDVTSSNRTTNHFLGITQKLWMNDGQQHSKVENYAAEPYNRLPTSTSLGTTEPSSYSPTKNNNSNCVNQVADANNVRISSNSQLWVQQENDDSTVSVGVANSNEPMGQRLESVNDSMRSSSKNTKYDQRGRTPSASPSSFITGVARSSSQRRANSSPIPNSAAVRRLRIQLPNAMTKVPIGSASVCNTSTRDPLQSPLSTSDAPQTLRASNSSLQLPGPHSFNKSSVATTQLITPMTSPVQQTLTRKRSLQPTPTDGRALVRQKTGSVASVNLSLSTSSDLNPSPYPSSHQQQKRPVTANTNVSQSITQNKAYSYLAGFEATISEILIRYRWNGIADLRIAWIRETCSKGDLFFLLLHQLVCMWTADRSVLKTRFGFVDAHDSGFQVLQALFGQNSTLPAGLLSYLAGFPNPPYMLNTSPELNYWIGIVRIFLAGLGQNWNHVMSLCIKRRYPPSPREIETFLGCPKSVILPKAFFSSIDRRIFPVYDIVWAGKIFQFFHMYQQRHFTQTHAGESQALNPKAIREQSREFGVAYTRLRAEHEKHLKAHSTDATSSLFDIYRLNPQISAVELNEMYRQTGDPDHLASRARSLPTSGMHTVRGVQPPIHNGLLPHFNQNQGAVRTALHQAHVVPCITRLKSATDVNQRFRFYQFVTGFAIRPQLLCAKQPSFNLVFKLSQNQLDRVVKYIPPTSGPMPKRSHRLVEDGSLLLHLRCVELEKDEPTPEGSQWVSSPTVYPRNCYISVNDKQLELRRRPLFRKDLEVDVTQIIHRGQNSITVSMHPDAIEIENEKSFAIGVEIVELLSHKRAFDIPKPTDAQQTLTSITNMLKAAKKDEDVVIIDSHISINLIDPFTSKLVETPVRGRSCRHRECFDLDAFLQSRTTENGGGLTAVYQWLCPFCKRDARPPNLVIDGFLQNIIHELKTADKIDVTAIHVTEDGRWESKTRENTTTVAQERQKADVNENGSASDKSTPNPQLTTPTSAVAIPASASIGGIRSTNLQNTNLQPSEIIVLD